MGLPELSDAVHVGRWWRRDGQVELDMVAGDREPIAHRIIAVGSIKCRENAPFDSRDANELAQAAALVPGAAGAHLVAVSRTPFTSRGSLHTMWTPDDLLAAWR